MLFRSTYTDLIIIASSKTTGSENGLFLQFNTDTSGSSIGFHAFIGGTDTLRLEGGSGNSYFNGGGNVGIGTSSPGAALTVVGAAGFGAGTSAAILSTTTTGNSATTLEITTGSGSAFDIGLFAGIDSV